MGEGLSAHRLLASDGTLSFVLVVLSVTLSFVLIIFMFILTVDPRLVGIGGVSKATEPSTDANNDALLFRKDESKLLKILQSRSLVKPRTGSGSSSAISRKWLVL